VTALAYAQTLPGLPGGDGHAGWLVRVRRCCWSAHITSCAGSTCTDFENSNTAE
jgi:hypothetical protein